MSFVNNVKLFNTISGNTGEFDKRKAALYVGLCFEELGEMVESFKLDEWEDEAKHLQLMGNRFKRGDFDVVMDYVDRVEFLDAAIDIAIVTLGAGIAIGGDIDKACNKVTNNNLSKFPLVDGVHTVLKDENGKIKKPEGFVSVVLDDCLN